MKKYHSIETEFKGKRFASRKEARRYAELCLMERTGEIKGLQTQVPFVLIPAQRDDSGRVVERAVTYRADFVYNDRDGRLIVEDTKGYQTEVYKIKRKLMLKVHGIRVMET